MKNNNIVLFSSGITERSGMLMQLVTLLQDKGYNCSYWRDLFRGAHNSQNIALLPTLIKKIPTFDFAILICEGHDVSNIIRNGQVEEVKTMRDNVLFEIGLCVMALGFPRVILVTDNEVRIPEDLIGINNELALKRFVYTKGDSDAYAATAGNIVDYMNDLNRMACNIDGYIKNSGDTLTPVVIGAASSTACGYVDNFIFRLLEHIDDGFESDGKYTPVDCKKVYLHIVLPDEYSPHIGEYVRNILNDYKEATIKTARYRNVNFRYKEKNDEIHIVDFPTTIGTSYETSKMILDIEADEDDDIQANERFMQKELNLFEATLRTLLKEDFLEYTLSSDYPDISPEERNKMKNIVLDIITNRLFIEHISC